MRAHFEAGDRAEALRTYRRCEQLLANELGVAPHPDTVDLLHEIDGRDRRTRADRD